MSMDMDADFRLAEDLDLPQTQQKAQQPASADARQTMIGDTGNTCKPTNENSLGN